MRTHLDLFSGIGGFALAANWAGFTTVGFVEYEDFPKRLLSRRFPGIPIHSDIHDFDGTPFRGVDLITGGFPCQPFSAAGKQRGKEDDRWLWKEMLRVIVEAQPTWVLAENVAGLINMALDEVLADLEAQDYATGTVILPACSQNALHRRDRVWIIAKSLADTKGNRTFCATEGSECNRSSEDEKARMPFTSDTSGASKDVAHSKYKGSQRGVSGGQNPQWKGQHGHTRCCSSSDIQPRENPSIVESRMGISIDGIPEGLDFPRRWGDGSWEDGIPRVTTQKKGRTQRLKGLGNAIVPQVAYEIIRHFD